MRVTSYMSFERERSAQQEHRAGYLHSCGTSSSTPPGPQTLPCGPQSHWATGVHWHRSGVLGINMIEPFKSDPSLSVSGTSIGQLGKLVIRGLVSTLPCPSCSICELVTGDSNIKEQTHMLMSVLPRPSLLPLSCCSRSAGNDLPRLS